MSGAAVILLDDNNRVLLLRRSKTAPWMPLRWGLPGGSIEPGESPIAAALRETFEETGLTLRKADFLTLWRSPDSKFSTSLFVARQNDIVSPADKRVSLNYEHDRAMWASLEDLKSLRLVPGIEPAIRRITMASKKINPSYRQAPDASGRVCFFFFHDDGKPYETELGHKYCFSQSKAEEILKKLEAKQKKTKKPDEKKAGGTASSRTTQAGSRRARASEPDHDDVYGPYKAPSETQEPPVYEEEFYAEEDVPFTSVNEGDDDDDGSGILN